jgi:hypothetical protein
VSDALPPVPEDRVLELKLAEIKWKTAKAETEGKKAELQIIREKNREVGVNKKQTMTVKAVVQYDAIGWKRELVDRMAEFNVAGNIARVARFCSSEFDTEVTFEGNNTNVGKMKKFLNEKSWVSKFESVSSQGFEEIVMKVEENQPFQGFSDITISKTPSLHHRADSAGIDSSGLEEKEFTLDKYEASMLKSVSSISGSSQGRDGEFAKNLLNRDFWMRSNEAVCLMCEEGKGRVQGAHIYPLNTSRILDYFNVTGSHNRNATSNGYLLCDECHGHHDDGLCGFDENWVITIEDALVEEPKYAKLRGVSVSLPTVLEGVDAPLRALLKIQQEFIKLRRNERHEKVDSSAGFCMECNKFFKRLETVTTHICHPMSKKLLFTPPPKRRSNSKDGSEHTIEEEKNAGIEDGKDEGEV